MAKLPTNTDSSTHPFSWVEAVRLGMDYKAPEADPDEAAGPNYHPLSSSGQCRPPSWWLSQISRRWYISFSFPHTHGGLGPLPQSFPPLDLHGHSSHSMTQHSPCAWRLPRHGLMEYPSVQRWTLPGHLLLNALHQPPKP